MRTIVYVDGFNLYYRALRDTPYRWLDPAALSDALLPDDEVIEVKYFTARIKGLPHDPGAPTHQQAYLRAMDTLPRVKLEFGFFNRRRVFHALAIGKVGQPLGWREKRAVWLSRIAFAGSGLLKMQSDPIPRLRVWKTEEKGSDVNLGSHLLVDGFNARYEQAAVLSNDSDLEWPIQYVRETLGLPVVVLNPSRHRNRRLAPEGLPSGAYKRIEEPQLAASQLPLEMSDAQGTFHRPPGWDQAEKR